MARLRLILIGSWLINLCEISVSAWVVEESAVRKFALGYWYIAKGGREGKVVSLTLGPMAAALSCQLWEAFTAQVILPEGPGSYSNPIRRNQQER